MGPGLPVRRSLGEGGSPSARTFAVFYLKKSYEYYQTNPFLKSKKPAIQGFLHITSSQTQKTSPFLRRISNLELGTWILPLDLRCSTLCSPHIQPARTEYVALSLLREENPMNWTKNHCGYEIENCFQCRKPA